MKDPEFLIIILLMVGLSALWAVVGCLYVLIRVELSHGTWPLTP
jgi:hypothetical protein